MYVKPYGYISWWTSKSPLLRHFKFDTADLHQKKHGNSLATSKVSLSKVEKNISILFKLTKYMGTFESTEKSINSPDL